MKDFATIDFETANHMPSSVCSVGVVIVRDRMVSEKIYSLIRPRPNFYTRFNTYIHGITPEDTEDAMAFPQVWNEISARLEGLTLIAHNSPFDERCLRSVHEMYEMKYPDYNFLCTCRASRRVFPSLPNHKLNTVAAHCGFDLANHHHALADAEACAAIALKVF